MTDARLAMVVAKPGRSMAQESAGFDFSLVDVIVDECGRKQDSLLLAYRSIILNLQ